jgi:hypothetical protein
LVLAQAAAVEIGEHGGVGRLQDDVLENFLRVGVGRGVADAGIEFGCCREVTELGEAAADVLDIFVDAKYFLDDKDGGEWAGALGFGEVGRQRAAGYRDFCFAGDEARGVGVGRGGFGAGDRGCETGDEGAHYECAPAYRHVESPKKDSSFLKKRSKRLLFLRSS